MVAVALAAAVDRVAVVVADKVDADVDVAVVDKVVAMAAVAVFCDRNDFVVLIVVVVVVAVVCMDRNCYSVVAGYCGSLLETQTLSI